MDLKIRDVADLLNVSETTIRRWVADGKIPNYRLNQHHYFSRSEIENWVLSRRLDNLGDGITPFAEHKEAEAHATLRPPSISGNKQFSLFRAIHKGDVLCSIEGKTKEEVIAETMQRSSKLLSVDAEVMTELLLDRERLMPTAINHGIAVPHTRDSLLSAHHDIVIVVFLDNPLEYGALDGEPVHTLFFLFACEDKRHLHILAKLAHLGSQAEMREFFKTKPSKEKLLAKIKEWEGRLL